MALFLIAILTANLLLSILLLVIWRKQSVWWIKFPLWICYHFFTGLLLLGLFYPSFLPLVKKAASLMKLRTISSKYLSKEIVREQEIEGIRLQVYSGPGNEKPSPDSKLLDFGEDVQLHAVFSRAGQLYSDNEVLLSTGAAKKLEHLPEVSKIEWIKLEPEYRYYMTKSGFKQMYGRWPDGKTSSGKYFNFFRLNKLGYLEQVFASGAVASLSQGCNTNHNLYWDDEPVGTMRYAVRAKVNGVWLYSTGKEELETGELERMELVHRISVKANSGYEILDMGFAHGGLPYYWGSYRRELGWYGSDCAKFVSVALYQSGLDIGYQGTAQLNTHRSGIELSGINTKGQLVAGGRLLEYGKNVFPGDVLLRRSSKSGHAALIGEDKNENGHLDVDDYILHTAWDAPKYEKIRGGTFSRKQYYEQGHIKLLSAKALAGR